MQKANQNSRMTGFLTATLIILGCFLRVCHYFEMRSLWWDESYVALNIIAATWKEIFFHTPFLINQPMLPLGFMVIQKVVVSCLGIGELDLRLLSISSAIASIFIFYKIVKKIFPASMVLIALTFFCLSDTLIYYSAELKTYSFDLFLSLLFYWFILNFKERKPKHWLLLWLISFFCLWSSFSFVFVLCAVSLCLGIKFLIQKKFIPVYFLVFFGILWCVNLYFIYTLAFKPMLDNTSLVSMWTQGFLPQGLSLPQSFAWPFQALTEALRNPGQFSFNVIAFCLYVVGLLVVLRIHKEFACILLATIVLPLIAGILGKYPFHGRVILFVFTGQVIFVSAGIFYLSQFFTNRKMSFIVGFLSVVLLYGNNYSNIIDKFINGHSSIDNREAMYYLFENWLPGDLIVYNNASQYSYAYYLLYYDMQDELFTIPLDDYGYPQELGNYSIVLSDRLFEEDSLFVAQPQIIRSEKNDGKFRILNQGLRSQNIFLFNQYNSAKVHTLTSQENVWLLLTHIDQKTKDFIVRLFSKQGVLKQRASFKNADVYLFRLSK